VKGAMVAFGSQLPTHGVLWLDPALDSGGLTPSYHAPGAKPAGSQRYTLVPCRTQVLTVPPIPYTIAW